MPSNYEDEANAILSASQDLLTVVFHDLDEIRGGTTWMHGQLDVARNCLVTDYLISSARGLQEATVASTFALEQYGAARTSDDFALKQRLKAVRSKNGPEISALGPHNLEHRTKALRVRLEHERSVFHMGQLLDRLAACVTVVGGLPLDLLSISWRQVQSMAKNGAPSGHGLNRTQTGDGRNRQTQMLKKIDAELSHNRDAFDWMWQYRNSVIHRSEMISWSMQAKTGPREYKMISPLPRQPDWAFHEAMIEERDSMEGLVILEDPADVLTGLWQLIEGLVVTALELLTALWLERRLNPSLVVQPGKQWSQIGNRRMYTFTGFGKPLSLAKNSSIHVAPAESRRIRAAKIFEADSEIWRDKSGP